MCVILSSFPSFFFSLSSLSSFVPSHSFLSFPLSIPFFICLFPRPLSFPLFHFLFSPPSSCFPSFVSSILSSFVHLFNPSFLPASFLSFLFFLHYSFVPSLVHLFVCFSFPFFLHLCLLSINFIFLFLSSFIPFFLPSFLHSFLTFICPFPP